MAGSPAMSDFPAATSPGNRQQGTQALSGKLAWITGLRHLVALAAATIAAQAMAYSVAPIRLLLEPVGNKATGRIEVRNTDSRPVTLSVVPNVIGLSAGGAVTSTPSDEDLLVFPPQLIVPGGQSQTVQVRYMGDATLAKARLFSVSIEQEAVDMATGQQAALKIGVNFVTAVVVQPAGAKPVVTIAGFRAVPGGLAVDISNDGDGALRLQALTFQLVGANGADAGTPGTIADFGESGFVMPGGKRTLKLPFTGDAAAVTAVKVGATG